MSYTSTLISSSLSIEVSFGDYSWTKKNIRYCKLFENNFFSGQHFLHILLAWTLTCSLTGNSSEVFSTTGTGLHRCNGTTIASMFKPTGTWAIQLPYFQCTGDIGYIVTGNQSEVYEFLYLFNLFCVVLKNISREKRRRYNDVALKNQAVPTASSIWA